MPEKTRGGTSRPPSRGGNRPAPRKPQPEVQPGLITSAENDKVKFLKNIANRRDRYAAKTFMAEGVRLVTEAFASHNPPTITLYDPEALQKTEAGNRLLLRLKEMLDDKKPVYPTLPRLIESVADTVTPQGVVAAVPFLNWTEQQLNSAKLHLVLDSLQDPGNLGTILRSAGATGDTTVWLTENSVDLYAPKVVRAGMGAHFRVPAANNLNWEALTAKLQAAGVEQILVAEGDSEQAAPKTKHSVNLDKISYWDVDWKQPTALIIGNEAHGLSPEALKIATAQVYIPMPGGAESLNAAVASSLVMFEALRQRLAQ